MQLAGTTPPPPPNFNQLNLVSDFTLFSMYDVTTNIHSQTARLDDDFFPVKPGDPYPIIPSSN